MSKILSAYSRQSLETKRMEREMRILARRMKALRALIDAKGEH